MFLAYTLLILFLLGSEISAADKMEVFAIADNKGTADQSDELVTKVSSAMRKAELPDTLIQKLQKNPAFITDMLICLESERYMWKLIDRRHPILQSYAPFDLVALNGRSYRVVNNQMQLRKAAEAALSEMAIEALTSGVVLTVGSAYRSYKVQEEVHNFWIRKMGRTTADRVSSLPGYSQHQTGFAVDFAPVNDSFIETAAYRWLAANASRFGWSLSYPDDYESVTGYKYESWHYRYVGKDLAAFIDNYFGGMQHNALRFLHELRKSEGTFIIAGMPAAEYDAAMNAKWQEISYSGEKPLDLNYIINKKYTYKEYEEFILNLAKYDYVTVYNMGETAEGKLIYNIEIFNPDDNVDSSKIRTIMLSAGIHANETMGPHVALKMAESFIKKAQKSKTLQEYLKHVRITILPCLNPDGRELVYMDNNIQKKSNALGIDINRAFPSINAGCLKLGSDNPLAIRDTVGDMYYPGEHLGGTKEVAIAMKWLNYYIINKNAQVFVDLHQHQKNNGIFYEKPFDIDSQKKKKKEFYDYLKSVLRAKGSLAYDAMFDSDDYGFYGAGGTITDYAYGVAMGLSYSSQYGRQVVIVNGKDATLLEEDSLNDYADYIRPVNANFVHATVEMTDSNNHKGFLPLALNSQLTYYNKQNYENLLVNLIFYIYR
jgi:D-alanyl-D-alanine carboxypeptidase